MVCGRSFKPQSYAGVEDESGVRMPGGTKWVRWRREVADGRWVRQWGLMKSGACISLLKAAGVPLVSSVFLMWGWGSLWLDLRK